MITKCKFESEDPKNCIFRIVEIFHIIKENIIKINSKEDIKYSILLDF